MMKKNKDWLPIGPGFVSIAESGIETMKKLKLLSVLLAIAMLAGLIAGCGGDKGNNKNSDSGNYKYGTVHGVSWTNGGQADRADETAVKRENDRNAEYLADTGNTRVCEAFTYDYRAVGAMFEGGQIPTVINIAATEPTKLISNGWGRDITEQVKAVGIDLTKFNQDILNTYKDKDGKIYGLPNSAYALSIFCNGQVFIDAGLVNDDGTPKLPTTWQEVLDYSKIIKDKTGKGGLTLTACDNNGGWQFTNVAWNFGADLVVPNDDGTFTAHVNSPEAVAAMSYYRDLALSGTIFGDPVVDKFDVTQNNVKAGNAAMAFSHSGCFAGVSRTDKDGMDPKAVYEISIPAGPDGTKINLTGGDGYWFAPNATDDQVIAVLEYFMHYGTWTNEVTSDMDTSWRNDFKDQLDMNGLNLPDFPVYDSAAREKKNEIMKEYQTNIDFDKQFGKFYEDVQQAGALQVEEEGDTQNLYRELAAVIQQIMGDPENADVQALMDTAQANVQQLLDDFVK